MAKLVGIRRVIGKEEGALTLLKAIEAELPAAQAYVMILIAT
jgi:hypothetical protein